MLNPPLIEIVLPVVIISFFSNLQISIYLLKQYHKHIDENLPFNRILLALSIFYGFWAVGYLLRMLSAIFLNTYFNASFYRLLGTFILFLGIVAFLFLTLLKSFREICNIKVVIVLIVINIYAMISIWIFVPSSLLYLLTLSLGFFSGFYVIWFQFGLINYATGEIRIRLYTIFLGEVLISACFSIFSLFYDFLSQDISTNPIFFLLTGLFLCGSVITLFGTYNFPAFVEFQWKNDLLGICIFARETFKPLYKFAFNTKFMEDNFFVSRDIPEIKQIITQMTAPNSEKIYKIKHQDFFVIFDYGNPQFTPIVYTLVIKRDLQSLRYFLKRIKTQFENNYKYFLKNLSVVGGKEETLFSSFNENIQQFLKE